MSPGKFLLAHDKNEKQARLGVYCDNFSATIKKIADFLGFEVS
jgi:hypothetical protein